MNESLDFEVAYVLPGHQMMLNTDLCLAFSNDNKGLVDLLPGLKAVFMGKLTGEDWVSHGEPLHLESSLMVESFLCHQGCFLFYRVIIYNVGPLSVVNWSFTLGPSSRVDIDLFC